MHGKTALITGATGFIGGRLCDRLAADGFRIRALVREASRAPAGVEPFPGDLTRPESLAGIEESVDLVVHGASLLGKWGTPENDLRAVNVDGALALLERFRGRPVGRYVHLSAGGVTGPVPHRQVDETWPPRPATAYERTKHEGEVEVLERSREWGIPVVVARPTFTYGPGDPHKIALFRAVKKGRYGFIGDGESVNHPVYIDDLLDGLALLAGGRGSEGEVYIIGGPRPVSKRELVNTIADCLAVARPRLRVPRAIAEVAARGLEGAGKLLGFEPILTRSRVMMMADNFGYSIDKARRELGYEPRVDLAEGIAKTVASFRAEGLL